MADQSPDHMDSTSSEEESLRTKIRPFGGKFLPYSHKISAYITKKFAELQCLQGHSWKYVDKETRDLYWKSFKEKYYWDTLLDADVKKTWNALVADLYKKTLCNWRKKPQPPQGVDPDVWEHWQTVWSTPEWKQKSVCGKRNRCSEPAGLGTGLSKHIGGSRSYVEHAMQLRADLEHKGMCWELFKKTHEKKDGTFVDARSQAINEKMNAKFVEASQLTNEDGLPQIPTGEAIDNMYMEVVGGVTKKRLYGIGSQAYVTFPEAMSGHAGRAASRSSSTAIADATARADTAVAHAAVATAEAALATAEVAVVNARCEALTKDNEALHQELDVLRQQAQEKAIRFTGDEAQATTTRADITRMQSEQTAFALQVAKEKTGVIETRCACHDLETRISRLEEMVGSLVSALRHRKVGKSSQKKKRKRYIEETCTHERTDEGVGSSGNDEIDRGNETEAPVYTQF
ncbi:uncharacterized protein [Henckelia pumila]|uniref:uncharacterized protein n=1 Tax=Henckelia pumila TaxID=405737 RepID=UPI003C6DC7A2